VSAETLAPQLQAHFTGILEQHMKDVPIVNPDVQIETRAWRVLDDNTLCVMITPWFMSLMLFPPEEMRYSADWKTGDTYDHAFPSGVYSFTAAFDEELGFYQSCSLFSPMFEFSNHELAVEVADAAMHALFVTPDDVNAERDSSTDSEENPHSGLSLKDVETPDSDTTRPGPHQTNEPAPLSRRYLLRAQWRGSAS